MRKKNNLLKLVIFALVACMAVCVLVSCGDNGGTPAETTEKNVDTANLPKCKATLQTGATLGTIKASAVKAEGDGTLYELVVTPKPGYIVSTMKIGDKELTVKDNKAECVLTGNVSVDVTYTRKDSDELQKRREKVIEKIQTITGTQFKYDRDYDYKITTKDAHIYAGALYQGMPYSNHPTCSFEAFLDFTTGKDADGVYLVGNILTQPLYVWGNNCADVIYWSWATISTTMNCKYTGEFSENFGISRVGDYELVKENFDDKNNYVNTSDICENNGYMRMFEAYGMCKAGDAVIVFHPTGGHILMVDSVKLVNGKNGAIDGDRSYILYYDQNSGYSEKNGINGKTVYASCSYQVRMTFKELFETGYIPVTCLELMDDEIEVEKEIVNDSISKSKLTKINVTRGYIESNYYMSKLHMEITDASGNVVYSANRYRDESNPKRIAFSWFTSEVAEEYKNIPIYTDILDLNSLPAGEYHCKVTAYLGTGSTYEVRDFQFTN